MQRAGNGISPCFRKTTLKNGVRVLSERIPSVRSVSVGAWVAAGSRDERAEERGISHFIEHMVFKGTRKRRMHHIARRMESVGGYLNAFTAKEYTCYYARALDEHLARAIDTVCDLILFPTLPEKEIEKEKGVILEEMKMYEDNPEELVFDRFESVVYDGHALGAPVIGYPQTVQSFDREMLCDYMRSHYVPDRVVLVVAGNADHDDIVRMAGDMLGGMPIAERPIRRAPVNGYVPHDFVESRPIQQAHFVMGARGLSVRNEDRVAFSVLNTLLGGGMSSRLNQNVREKYGFCYNIGSFANMHSDSGDFGVYAASDVRKMERVKKLIRKELRYFVEVPIGSRTLNEAKNQLRGAMMLGLEGMSNRMMGIGRQELYFGRYLTLDEISDAIGKVTVEDVQRVASMLFKGDQLSTAALVPEG
ncbi:MAG: insulinase family protein [Bacteroidetes bacterium SB0662_bin_6]|nr:insulinase family protein [Bacteroidetes bacterium SB0668_bin_1]MYE04911.1 insulinase family protein [Bacteroidetes bacterium SB0662_bin_6]